MTYDPGRRRRFAASYVLSLILHGLAALLFVILAIDVDTGSTEVVAPIDVALVQADAPAEPRLVPVVSPLPAHKYAAVPTPSRPSVAPAVVQAPAVARAPTVAR